MPGSPKRDDDFAGPAGTRGAGGGSMVDWFRTPEWGLVASIAAILGLIYLLDPSHAFFQEYNLNSLVQQIGLYGVLALGASVVIISGGIDLSVGAVVALTSVVSAKLLTEWLRNGENPAIPPSTAVVVAAMALTLLLGLAIGLGHAFLINHLRLPPFIATLASMSGLRSLASIICSNKQINVPYPAFRSLGSGEYKTFATFGVVAIAVAITMGATVLGRHLYAMGGNEAAARLSGLKINRLKMFAYGLSGMLAALAGILFTGRSGQADYKMGISYELYAITAAVVGGCSLSGGVGSVRGTVLGLVLLQTLIKGTALVVKKIDFMIGQTRVLIELNSTQVEGLVLGSVILIAVAVNQRFRVKS
ncbi:ABC transporter permease [Tundrisphaera sp. TA3]|uniref:ABC transporter permease n=1 Tax=Tundrisphaera sp. TA3 TaxID=3435775 RepID=UPI003EB92CD1